MGTETLRLLSGPHWAEMGQGLEKLPGVGLAPTDPELSPLSMVDLRGLGAQTREFPKASDNTSALCIHTHTHTHTIILLGLPWWSGG